MKINNNPDVKYAKEDIEKVGKSEEQIFYHLKYRNTNPQKGKPGISFQETNNYEKNI